jgi:hypothetical protein
MSRGPRDQGPRPVTVLAGGRGWTTSTLDHLHIAPSFCRGHEDVTHGGPREFVSRSYCFPQHCKTHRLSVGAGLFTNHCCLAINKHKREVCHLLTRSRVTSQNEGKSGEKDAHNPFLYFCFYIRVYISIFLVVRAFFVNFFIFWHCHTASLDELVYLVLEQVFVVYNKR